jgi:phenylacetate-CoA ligase
VYDALELIRFGHMSPVPTGGAWRGGDRYAVVSASGGHFLGNASVRRMQSLCPWLRDRLRLFSIMEPVATLVRGLNAFRPTWLATYPSAALLLAEERAAGRLDIAPAELRVGGERLTEAERQHLEAAFSCVVRNDYGCSEFPPVTWACAQGTMHVNSDWCVLEPVDRSMRASPAGSASHTVLITNLANRVQPVIRYDLGDSVTWLPDPCRCGSPHPAIRVEGRCDDTLCVTGDEGARIRLLPLALTTVLEERAGVFRFQLFQAGERSLELHLPPDGAGAAIERRAREALGRYLATLGAGRVRIEIAWSEPADRGASGKQQRIFARPSHGARRASPGRGRPEKP